MFQKVKESKIDVVHLRCEVARRLAHVDCLAFPWSLSPSNQLHIVIPCANL